MIGGIDYMFKGVMMVFVFMVFMRWVGIIVLRFMDLSMY